MRFEHDHPARIFFLRLGLPSLGARCALLLGSAHAHTNPATHDSDRRLAMTVRPCSFSTPSTYTMSPSGDAWTQFTRDMSPAEYRAFGAFVDRVDPNAGTDVDKLEALRMTWAASTGNYPTREGWPKLPSQKSQPRASDAQARDSHYVAPPLWFRLLLALLALGMLIGAWSKPPMIAYGMGTSQAIQGSWNPVTYAISGFGVFLLIVWLIFFWKD